MSDSFAGSAHLESGVDALLFDLGHVVIDVDMMRIHTRWSALAGVPFDQRHAQRVISSDAFRQHERGELTDAAFFAFLRRELEVDLTDAAENVAGARVCGLRAVEVATSADIERALADLF